jgi:hypothetical protein
MEESGVEPRMGKAWLMNSGGLDANDVDEKDEDEIAGIEERGSKI